MLRCICEYVCAYICVCLSMHAGVYVCVQVLHEEIISPIWKAYTVLQNSNPIALENFNNMGHYTYLLFIKINISAVIFNISWIWHIRKACIINCLLRKKKIFEVSFFNFFIRVHNISLFLISLSSLQNTHL